MASPARWTWVWVNSRSWWWTGRPGVLWFMGSQRVRHNWAPELNWSHVQLFLSPWTAAYQASQSSTLSQSLLKLMPIESVMPSNHFILCFPRLFMSSFFLSIRIFSRWISSLHQVAKILEHQLHQQFFQWIFRVDFLQDWLIWFPCSPRDLKSLLQHHNLNMLPYERVTLWKKWQLFWNGKIILENLGGPV